jgi:prophage antirepressor-like protein
MELAQSSSAYDINNLLVSTFKDNNITIYGTWEEPLFKAKDIGDLLGIKNIRDTVGNFDDTQKIKIQNNTVGNTDGIPGEHNTAGNPNTWFLTEEGLYELLYISRKPMAKEFRAHVSKLLKEQRLKLGEEMKNQSLLEVAKERESHLLEKFKDCAGVYFLKNPILRLCKFGSSKNVGKRVKEHRRDFGEQFRLHHVVKTPKYADLENGVRRFQNTEHNGHVEIIRYEDDNELQSIYKNTERESHLLSYEESNDLEIRKMEYQCEIEKEKTKQLQLQLEIKRLEVAQASNNSNDVAHSSPIAIQSAPPPTDNWKIADLLVAKKGSKVLLLNIIKKYKDSHLHKDNGYGHYNGYSKDLKIRIEEEIKQTFGLSAIKNNGKIYYLGLKFVGHTSFYHRDVYQNFVSKYIQIPPENVRFEKIPPGMFKYKAPLNTLQDLFYSEYAYIEPLYEPRCATGFTALFKKEFIEMICELCNVKPPSYTNKTVKYFNGICLVAT